MLTQVLRAANLKQLKQQLEELHPQANLVEIRIDYLDGFEVSPLKKIIQAASTPILLTARTIEQGGMLTDKEYHEMLQTLISLKPAYLDVEYWLDYSFIRDLKQQSPETQLIYSYHNLMETPSDLSLLIKQFKGSGCQMLKVATHAQSVLDTMRILSFIKQHAPAIPLTVHCMGEYGITSRLLGPAFGSRIIYTTDQTDNTPAEGMINIDTLLNIYHIKKLNRRSTIYGLIGDPIEQSPGHLFHNKFFHQEDINSIYVKFHVKSHELERFIQLSAALGIKGFSITMPHKQKLFKLLKEHDQVSLAAYSTNTLKLINGCYQTTNTDGLGLLQAMGSYVHSQEDNRILILGNGGSALGIFAALKDRAVAITIACRDGNSAARNGLPSHVLTQLNSLSKSTDSYDVIINTIPRESIASIITEKIPTLLKSAGLFFDITSDVKPILKDKQCYLGRQDLFIAQAILQQDYWSIGR